MKLQVHLLAIHADKDNLAASAEENLNFHTVMCFNVIFKQFSFFFCVICTSNNMIDSWVHMHGNI